MRRPGLVLLALAVVVLWPGAWPIDPIIALGIAGPGWAYRSMCWRRTGMTSCGAGRSGARQRT